MAAESFTCPRCGMTSHNPNDIREGYCGNCHDWTGADDAAGRLLQNIFGATGPGDGPPFTHTLKLPETEEEMAAEPPPSFILEEHND